MFPRQSPTTHTEQLGAEVAVYDRARAQVHALNPTAARVWRQCDGATSPDAMAAALARDLVPEAEAVVDLTLRELARLHLLNYRLTHARIDRRGPGAGCSAVALRRRCCPRSLDRGAVARGSSVAAAADRSDADEHVAESRSAGHHGGGHRDRKRLRNHGGRERDRRHGQQPRGNQRHVAESDVHHCRQCRARSPKRDGHDGRWHEQRPAVYRQCAAAAGGPDADQRLTE